MKQKNILLVFCDQLRSDMISVLGNPVVKTPAFDLLVSRGITFRTHILRHLYVSQPATQCIPEFPLI
jgi:arylsulfatase A-like enzyme